MLNTTFGSNQTNRFEVIQFLINFTFSSAAILHLEKWRFWYFRCLGGAKTQLCANFGENRTNASGVIPVFENFNMAAFGHIGLWISTFWDHRLVPRAKWMTHTKFGAYRTNRFDVIQFIVNFSFSSAAILDFEKWRFWHLRCLGCVISKPCATFGENRSSGVIQVFANINMAAGGHVGL